MKIIETHCHLDYLKNEPLEDIISKAQACGVEKIITIGVDPENLDKVKAISEANEIVYYTQGIHPHDAKDATTTEFQKIKQRALESKMVAVGEIGLDYHYNNSPREKQLEVFEEQLQIAVDVKKPIVIHSRDACDDMVSMLNNFANKLDRRGVVHSFTSTKKLATKALDEGFCLGFNGIITFKNAHEVREILEYCPIERILVETDAPFLTPVPHRGKENAPFYLPHIIEKIAEVKKMDLEEVCEMTYQNAKALFFT